MAKLTYPSVQGGPLSQQFENEVARSVLLQSEAIAQPMTTWLLLSTTLWGGKRYLATRIAKLFGISVKAMQSGEVTRVSTRRRGYAKVNAFIQSDLVDSDSDVADRKRRALARMSDALAAPDCLNPCTLFHQTIGVRGGDLLEHLAASTDRLSSVYLRGEVRQAELATCLVGIAERLGAVPEGRVQPRPDLDPGLDALLMLVARLDRETGGRVHSEMEGQMSLFGLLVESPAGAPARTTRHRLLDLLYAFAFMLAEDTLPMSGGSVRELEQLLLGGPPEDGGQSWIVRWRNGRKHLRLADIERMAEQAGRASSTELRGLFSRLWSVAQFWELVSLSGAQGTRIASERYAEWWRAMTTDVVPREGPKHPYWRVFEPHACTSLY